MQIRLIEPSDLEAVYLLEVTCYKNPWTKDNFSAELNDNDYAYMYVVEYQNQIIGYGGFWLIDEFMTITKLTVNPALRNKGIGKFILNEILMIAKAKGAKIYSLEVRVSNIPAINLYTKFGFKEIGIRPHYYGDGEDALIMHKVLEGSENYEENYYRN